MASYGVSVAELTKTCYGLYEVHQEYSSHSTVGAFLESDKINVHYLCKVKHKWDVSLLLLISLSSLQSQEHLISLYGRKE
jgi:hypothetical protein